MTNNKVLDCCRKFNLRLNEIKKHAVYSEKHAGLAVIYDKIRLELFNYLDNITNHDWYSTIYLCTSQSNLQNEYFNLVTLALENKGESYDEFSGYIKFLNLLGVAYFCMPFEKLNILLPKLYSKIYNRPLLENAGITCFTVINQVPLIDRILLDSMTQLTANHNFKFLLFKPEISDLTVEGLRKLCRDHGISPARRKRDELENLAICHQLQVTEKYLNYFKVSYLKKINFFYIKMYIEGLAYIKHFLKPDNYQQVRNFLENISWEEDTPIKIFTGESWLFKFVNKGVYRDYFNELAVERYLPGQGMPSRNEGKDYAEVVMCITIGGFVELEFNNQEQTKKLLIHNNSLHTLSNEVRYDWNRQIRNRKFEQIHGHRYPRETTYILTFRKFDSKTD